MRKRGGVILLTLTILLPAFLFLLACYFAVGHWQLKRVGVVTLGEVIDLRVIKKSKFATVRFEAPDGTVHILQENGSVPRATDIGDKVEVIFHPDRPDNAHVVSTQWTGVILLLFFSFLIGVVGGLFRYRLGRKAR